MHVGMWQYDPAIRPASRRSARRHPRVGEQGLSFRSMAGRILLEIEEPDEVVDLPLATGGAMGRWSGRRLRASSPHHSGPNFCRAATRSGLDLHRSRCVSSIGTELPPLSATTKRAARAGQQSSSRRTWRLGGIASSAAPCSPGSSVLSMSSPRRSAARPPSTAPAVRPGFSTKMTAGHAKAAATPHHAAQGVGPVVSFRCRNSSAAGYQGVSAALAIQRQSGTSLSGITKAGDKSEPADARSRCAPDITRSGSS